ncbi:unnamed protein product, partial [Didymodactylos carnosus]
INDRRMNFNTSADPDRSTPTIPYIDEIDRVLVSYEKAKYYLSEISKRTETQSQLWKQRREGLENILSPSHHQSLYDYLMPKVLRTNELVVDIVTLLCRIDLLTEQIAKVEPKCLQQPQQQIQSAPVVVSSTPEHSHFHNRQIHVTETLSHHDYSAAHREFDVFLKPYSPLLSYTKVYANILIFCFLLASFLVFSFLLTGMTSDKHSQQQQSVASIQGTSSRNSEHSEYTSRSKLNSNRLNFPLNGHVEHPIVQTPVLTEQLPTRKNGSINNEQQSANNSAPHQPDVNTPCSIYIQEKRKVPGFVPIDKPVEYSNNSHMDSPSTRAQENARPTPTYPISYPQQEPGPAVKDRDLAMNSLNLQSPVPLYMNNVSSSGMRQQQKHSSQLSRSSSITETEEGVRKVICPLQRIEPGTLWEHAEVIIVDHPSAFYLQNKEPRNIDLFSKMSDNLNTHYNRLYDQKKLKSLNDIEDGDFCVSQYENRWYRARILHYENDQVQIVYVDYGNMETKHVSEVFSLHREFSLMPAQVIGATLSEAFPNVPMKKDNQNSMWSEEVIDKFRQEVLDKDVEVHFVDKTGAASGWPLHFVTLIVDNQTITNSMNLKQDIKVTANDYDYKSIHLSSSINGSVTSSTSAATASNSHKTVSSCSKPYQTIIEKPSCKLQSIAPGTLWRRAVVVNIDHLSAFYIRNHEHYISQQFSQMENNLNTHYGDLEKDLRLKPLTNFAIGDYCVAKYKNCWLRARILQCVILDNKVGIVHIDYGTSDTKELLEIYELNEKFSLLPAQVVACTLSEVLSGLWSSEAIQIFHEEVLNKELQAEFVDSENITWPLYFVKLIVNNQSVTKNANLSPYIQVVPNARVALSYLKLFTALEYVLYNVPIENEENDRPNLGNVGKFY